MIAPIIFGCLSLIMVIICVMNESATTPIWILLTAMFFGVAIHNHNEKHKRETVVETRIPPQIDTTITLVNGVADTTYTYHFPTQELDTNE